MFLHNYSLVILSITDVNIYKKKFLLHIFYVKSIVAKLEAQKSRKYFCYNKSNFEIGTIIPATPSDKLK